MRGVPAPRDVWWFYVAPGSPLPESRLPIRLPSDLTAKQEELVRRTLLHERARWMPVIPFALRIAADALRRDD